MFSFYWQEIHVWEYEVSGCLQCCVFCVCFKLFSNILSEVKYLVFLMGSGAQAGWWSAGQKEIHPELELELHLVVLRTSGHGPRHWWYIPESVLTTGEIVSAVKAIFGVCGLLFYFCSIHWHQVPPWFIFRSSGEPALCCCSVGTYWRPSSYRTSPALNIRVSRGFAMSRITTLVMV